MRRVRDILSKCLIVVAMITGFFTFESIPDWRLMGYLGATALISIVLAYFLILIDPEPAASDPAQVDSATAAKSEKRGKSAI